MVFANCLQKNRPQKDKLSKALYLLVIAIGFEPMTVCLEGRCSIQLSYATKLCGCKDTNVTDCKKYFFNFLPFL